MTQKELTKVIKYVREVMAGSSEPQHTFGHAERVRKNALRIVTLLKIKDLDINLLQAACYLHDVPVAIYDHNAAFKHFFENYAVTKYLPGILEDLNFGREDKKILFDSIYRHSFTIPYRRLKKNGDIYGKILQDADSLDFLSSEREKSFNVAKKRFLFYFILSLFSKRFFRYARNNIKLYLNFPELSEYNWYGK